MEQKRCAELSDSALERVAGGITVEDIHIGSGQSAPLTLDTFKLQSAVDVPPEALDAFNAAQTSGGTDIASLVSQTKGVSVMTDPHKPTVSDCSSAESRRKDLIYAKQMQTYRKIT